jgi:hypothetical protein
MGNQLKDFEFGKQFKVADDEQKQANMEQHQKNPQDRLVSAHGGK